MSKVANFSVDLPEATVAIQVSGTFGSRQEEAQRLGRVLRPKSDGRTAHFYTIVTRETVDADFAAKRQRFLAEQGYAYRSWTPTICSTAARPPDRKTGPQPTRLTCCWAQLSSLTTVVRSAVRGISSGGS